MAFIGDTFDSPFSRFGGNTFGDLTELVLQGSIILSGVFILFMFAFGGFSLIMGAGNDNPEQAAKGKKALTAALAGFIIIISAYWVVRIIEIIVGYNFTTNAPGVI